MDQNKDFTVKFELERDRSEEIKQIVQVVYTALTEKGYKPVEQIVGYIMSGDPTFITSHLNARNVIKKVDRDELLEEFVKVYFDHLK
ncbi:IreB family regulatory phosphoprotein [Alkalibaculum bacchi]|uniref:IreB family regulatory phosphoprotein n=1 Tax=Alkalibaculum bacchi TaxID=645887 RepID=UPI0026F27A97|nr:IreB family regulatory phosphoprotein [Alkalibaculum bacchi]